MTPEVAASVENAYRMFARYDLRVDYRQPPMPPLAPENAAWAAAVLRG